MTFEEPTKGLEGSEDDAKPQTSAFKKELETIIEQASPEKQKEVDTIPQRER